jgi:hypothetical protein
MEPPEVDAIAGRDSRSAVKAAATLERHHLQRDLIA